MCVAAAAVTMAATAVAGAVSAYSSIEQGRSQAKWANYQANQAQADANAEASLARVEAEKIREAGKRQRSQARAAMAASGIDVDEGTAVNINEDISKGAEEDALHAIWGGIDRQQRGYAQAQADRSRGKQAQTAGNLNATATLLNAGSQAYGQYKGWRR